MFSYLRYFSVISLVVVMAGAWILGLMLTRLVSGDFIAQQQAQHLATIDSYTSTVWRSNTPPAGGQNDPIAAARLQQESQRFFAQQPVAKITIFSPDVRQLYFSSTRAYATTDGTKRVTLFDLTKIQRSQATSRLLTNVFLTGGTDATMPRTLLQSIVPIRSSPLTSAQQAKCALANAPSDAPCMPEALVEIYTDITPLMQRLTRMQYIVSGAVVVTFLLLLGILMVTAMRAETIISRQHEINLELTAAASAAEAQNREKSQFLANISHELRTPLNAIIGFSDLIKNEAGHLLSESHQSYVTDIHNSGKHLLSLINDILDYSKAEAGKLQLDWVESDLGKIIRNSLRMVMPRAETAQVMLVEDILTESLVMVTDSKKLKQVLLNLLSNAVKFTPAGGEVRCSVWEEITTQQIVIQVKDTGIGIAPKDLSKVMMPFGQVDSSLARKYEGTGLGLPLASKFVEIMGGKFLIESELGKGTTITIHLPKTPKNLSTQKQESSHVRPDPGVETT
jgi:two-component system cell cycle sensor histidine kinase PleC